ncbi:MULTISPECIES: VanZ family protein [unclassified Streptomyces]|uniref:VanZ family protein n=1 Tax=unclassified Streptomyces TaxID=2593676 RepID=UPI0036EA3F3D
MIDASIQAVPGLLLGFGLIALFLAVPTGLIARVRRKPVTVRVLFTVSLAGVFAVTLLPTDGGPVGSGAMCDLSSPYPQMFTSSSALLNIGLFIPAAFFATLVFRRPLTTMAVAAVGSGLIELVQAEGSMGRSCSATDIAANTTGALLGLTIGTVWSWRTGQGTWRAKRDVLWGAVFAVTGSAALIGTFHSSVDPYTPLTERPGFAADPRAVEDANAWISEAAAYVFGRDVQVEQTVIPKHSGLVTAKTNRGEISGLWPQKKLEEAAFTDNMAEAGSLNQHQAQQVSTRFVERWFPTEVHGAKRTVHVSGSGNTAVYMFVYRRYSAGLMMPMRLNVAVTSGGRILNFAARAVEDPNLPKVAVSKDEAARLARKNSGHTVQGSVLLAQMVQGEGWRPVWMMGVEKGDVFIDAVTGNQIPQSSLIR